MPKPSSMLDAIAQLPVTRYGVPLALAGVMMLGMSAAPRAQRGRRGGADANQGLPVATNTIAEHPDAYYGKQVTITAGVEQVLSKTVFLLDQRKAAGPHATQSIGKPILVIAPYMTAALSHENYLLVRGEIVKLDPAAMAGVAAEFKPALTPDLVARYSGQPVVLAAAVINSTYVDLARKPLPPPSAAEVSMTTAMKTINPVFAALRTAAQESKTEAVRENVAKLQPALSQAETIWDDLGQIAAAQWARDAQAHASSIERDAAAGNWEGVKTSAGALNQVCQTCHGAYREREEDGTFRIKAGSF